MAKKPVLRTCAVCHSKTEKKDLLRIVRSPEGEISIDIQGKKPGRGAYMCVSIDCIENARKSKKLERILGVSIDDVIYDEAVTYVKSN